MQRRCSKKCRHKNIEKLGLIDLWPNWVYGQLVVLALGVFAAAFLLISHAACSRGQVDSINLVGMPQQVPFPELREEMTLELMGAVVGLLKAVLDAKEKTSNFQHILTSLESTVRAIIPRLDEISPLNHKFEKEELDALIDNGKILVIKCSKISAINFINEVRYSKELLDLDHFLLRYFQTILPLDNSKDIKGILVLLKELQTNLEGEESYQEEPLYDLFLLKGSPCPYDFDLGDILSSEFDRLGEESCKLNTKYGAFRIKGLKDLKVGTKELKQQIEDLAKVGQHPNVMPPFGYFFYTSLKYLLLGYAEGNLSALLHDIAMRLALDWDSRLKIALGAAKGISHLHSAGGDKFIYGNIKSSNILLTPELDACICDYGLATITNVSFFGITSQKPEYHSPEFIESRQATQKSDVYSFGVMLLEILMRKNPARADLPSMVCSVTQKEWTYKVFDFELLGNENREVELEQMLIIAMQCVVNNPDKRPKMVDIVWMLKKIRPSQ